MRAPAAFHCTKQRNSLLLTLMFRPYAPQSDLSSDGKTVPARCAFMIAPLTSDVDTSVPVTFGEGFKLICANELQVGVCFEGVFQLPQRATQGLSPVTTASREHNHP